MSPTERLHFPDAPRSDLDRALEDIVANAQRVLATQGRLRHLLEANRAVVEQLDLAEVLRRITRAAVKLVDAEYGALGVVAPDGTLEQFIHVGISSESAELIGNLPEGHGLLGAVIDAGKPIRIEHLSDDARSSGFPDPHPAMDGFLGVPIRVRDVVFGNLYLTNRADGPFTQEDEDLVTALAATAGIAIANARLFDDSKRRQQWSAAIAEVTSALLSGTSEDALAVVADQVASIVDADLVCIVVRAQREGYLLVDTARGHRSEVVLGRVYPALGSLVGRALAAGAPASTDTPMSSEHLDWMPDLGPSVAIPLIAFGSSLGALTITRAVGGARFTDAELQLAAEFAAQASVGIQLARGRTDSVQLELVEERNRIARDLHDHVIQRLFASGLSLQSLIARAPVALQGKLGDQVDAIDVAIGEIRTAVFTLSSRPAARPVAVRHLVLDVVSEYSSGLGAAPRLTFSGPVDLLVDGPLASDVVAVVREGLSNIVRHADSTACSVDVTVSGNRVTVTVDDDGQGMPTTSGRSSGTANLADRAAAHGGDFTMTPRLPRGTSLLWTAPLPAIA